MTSSLSDFRRTSNSRFRDFSYCPAKRVGLPVTITDADGKLNFASSSTLLFGLGTNSDVVAFNAAGDWLSGSANATLQLDVTLAGFSYANTYTVFNNVTTDGFTLANITGYDAVNYTANFADAGSGYQVNFVPEPGSAVSLLAELGMVVALRRMRRRSS